MDISEQVPDKRALKSAPKGSRVRKRFKPTEMRSKLAQLKAGIAALKTDLEIAEELELGTQAYNDLKKELYRQETQRLYAQSTEEVYLDYLWVQSACVKSLDRMLAQPSVAKNHNAFVGAVRAKSDIMDKIVKTGQDMGVLEKAPERKMILHGVAVAKLDNNNLRKLITRELEGLSAVIKKYGDTDLLGNPITKADPPPDLPAELPPPPAFTDHGKPSMAMGGIKKRDAAKKARFIERVKAVAPPTDDG